MFASVKKTLITLVVLTAIAATAAYVYVLNRTFLNDEEELGNLTGNIYNGGLFCEDGSYIYFSNDNDDGSLYVMNSDCTSVKKLHADKAAYINVDENYIYYLRANNTRENTKGGFLMFNNTGMYRIKQNGMSLKLISNKPGCYLTLKGNYVYYQGYDVENGLRLFQSKIDCKEEKLLLADAAIPAQITENRLYYTGTSDNHNINYMNLSSYTTHTMLEGSFAYPIFSESYIYYIDMDNGYTINRMNSDGTDRQVLVDERCSTYNITVSGNYIYYQVDEGRDSRICRMDTRTLEAETLLSGDYKQIHVTSKYVFFKAYDNTNTFILAADDIVDLGTFDPPAVIED